MAFTVTMMAWSVLEYGEQMAAVGELGHAVEAIKWGTDYFVKAHPEANVLYGEVRTLGHIRLFSTRTRSLSRQVYIVRTLL
jgi:hypothetical protein